jgi:hypothetical protein
MLMCSCFFVGFAVGGGFTASSSRSGVGWAGSLAWIGSQMVSWVVGDNWAACGVRLRIGSWSDAGFGVDRF